MSFIRALTRRTALRTSTTCLQLCKAKQPSLAICGRAGSIVSLERRVRLFTTSRQHHAEEAPMMPLETDIMNLLGRHKEFQEVTNSFVTRLQKLLNLDIFGGELPSPTDMLNCANDEELRSLSVRMAEILKEEKIEISEDTVKQVFDMLGQGRK